MFVDMEFNVQYVHWPSGYFAANGFSCFIAEFLSKHCGKLEKNLNKNKFRNIFFQKHKHSSICVAHVIALETLCDDGTYMYMRCTVPSLISLIHCFWRAVFHVLFLWRPKVWPRYDVPGQ